MALFIKILLTMFIAEMGDKTQLLLVAMTSRFKLRDIILGSAAAILVLNGLAVGVGSLISRLIPGYLIKIIAALAFFFFAWSSLSGDGGEEEAGSHKESRLPALTVFATFFVAELGDKTQLTAITFAANEGLSHAVTIWLACSLGLFAFVIFAIFGCTTLLEGCTLLFGGASPLRWAVTGVAAAIFAGLCLWTVLSKRKGPPMK